LLCILVAVNALTVTAAAQQDGRRGINLIPSGNERLGTGPSHFFWIRNGVSGVVDTIANDIVFIDDAGQVISRAPLPAGFVVGRVINSDGQVILEAGDGNSQIALQRTLDVNAPSLSSTQARSAPVEPTIPTVTRHNDKHLSLRSVAANQLHIRSVTRGYLADSSELARDSSGQRYVQWSEVVSTAPEIIVRSFVGRYAGDGRLNGLAEVPIDDMDYVPVGYGTVTAQGELRVLIPSQEGLEIRRLSFRAINPIDIKSKSFSLPQGSPRTLERSKATTIKVETLLLHQGEGTPPMPRLEQRGQRSLSSPTPITRDEAIRAAREFIAVTWTLGEQNISHSDAPNQCAPPGQRWERPRKFEPSMIGKSQVGVPYNWGGFDSSSGFVERINQGALAGNVCTCRDGDCVVSAAAGVDCSGFVSRAWKLTSHHGTSELPAIAPAVNDPGANFRNAKKGDVFNKAGSHVRLFVSVQEAPLRITVLESITAKTCTGVDGKPVAGEGVAECSRSIAEFNRFKLLRYKNIRD
jgi:hypothetical protein